MSVPVDDAQPNCALSGERFETFWDDASEEWRYRDAVRMDAAQAARSAATLRCLLPENVFMLQACPKAVIWSTPPC